MIHIGNRIAYFRKQKKLTQSKLATKICISRSYLASLETGEQEFPEDLLILIAKHLCIPKELVITKQIDSNCSHLLTKLFQNLVVNNLNECSILLSKFNAHYPDITQDISLQLLKTVYYYKNREFKKSKKIETTYLNFFLNLLDRCIPNYLFNYIHYYMMVSHNSKNQFSRALDPCIKLLKNLENSDLYLWISFDYIYILLDLNNHLAAQRVLDDITTELFKTKYYKLIAKSYIVRTVIYSGFHKYKEAIHSANLLEIYAKKHSILDYIGLAHHQKGYYYMLLKDFDNALFEYSVAYNLLKNTDYQVLLLINLISLSIKTSSYEKASIYISEIENLSLSEYEKMCIHSYKGELALYSGYEKEHWKYQKVAIKYFKENNHKSDLIYIYDFLAKFYYQENKYKKSAYYYHEKEVLLDEKNN